MSSSVKIPTEWLEHDAQVRPYIGAHRWLGGMQILLGLVLVSWGLKLHALSGLEAWWTRGGLTGLSLFIAYFGALWVIWELLTWPFAWGHYWVDRHYGVSKQGVRSWLADSVKAWVVGAAIGMIALTMAWAAMTQWGGWLLLSVLFILFTVVLAQLAPVLLLPLFFKLTPLPAGGLRDALIELSRRFGVRVSEVYLLGLGAKTEKGNAAFMGLGSSQRIAIGDTIYHRYPEEEVLAVFAHELGHKVHQDIWKGLALSAVQVFLVFGVSYWISTQWILPRWFTWIETPFGLFLYFLVAALVALPLGVVERLFSRWRERHADAFAARLGFSQALAAALERLTYQNKGLFVPNRWREFVLYSHPAPWRRILGLRG